MIKIVDVNYDSMDCYILCDQPTICGLCGVRTDIQEINDVTQIHECLNPECGYKFITEKYEEGNMG